MKAELVFCLWLPLAAAVTPPPEDETPELELLEFLGEWEDGTEAWLDSADEAPLSIRPTAPAAEPWTSKESDHDD